MKSMIVQETDDSITIQFPEFTIRDGVLYSAYPGIRTAEIPEGVKELAMAAFELQKNLVSVTFPSTLKKVGAGAFYECTELREVSGAVGKIEYGADAFLNCKKLKRTTKQPRRKEKF